MRKYTLELSKKVKGVSLTNLKYKYLCMQQALAPPVEIFQQSSSSLYSTRIDCLLDTKHQNRSKVVFTNKHDGSTKCIKKSKKRYNVMILIILFLGISTELVHTYKSRRRKQSGPSQYPKHTSSSH